MKSNSFREWLKAARRVAEPGAEEWRCLALSACALSALLAALLLLTLLGGPV